jgi:ribonuclease HIII
MIQKHLGYIGADEVGVGDYFGGMVTCACYVENKDEELLKNLGIRDSKKLTDNQMIDIFNKIKNIVKYTCLVFNPEKYNACVDKFDNTHIVKAYMHDLTIKKLIKDNGLDNVPIILDQFVPRDNYIKYFNKIGVSPINIDIFETKAEDKYICVACASIIARVAFIKHMNELRKTIGINFPLGASDKRIITDAKIIFRKGGIDLLKKYVKIGFKTTNDVIGN